MRILDHLKKFSHQYMPIHDIGKRVNAGKKSMQKCIVGNQRNHKAIMFYNVDFIQDEYEKSTHVVLNIKFHFI